MGTPSCKDAAGSLSPRQTMVEGCEPMWPGGLNRDHQGDGWRSSDFDDLVFLPASLGQRNLVLTHESGDTGVQLGKRYASRPLELSLPFLLAPMGLESREWRLALTQAATRLDTAYNTGAAGLLPGVSELDVKIVLQVGPSRLGISPRDLHTLAAIEIVLNTANHGICFFPRPQIELESTRPSERPGRLDFALPAPVIDFHNLNTLRYKVLELREATNYEIPICLRAGGDMAEVIRLAAACEVDVVTIDGLQADSPGGPALLVEHVGLPTLAALAQAVRIRKDLELEEDMDLVVSGGIRCGADAAKCLALGARAVALGHECLLAMDCQACHKEGSGGIAAGVESETAGEFSWESTVTGLVDYCTGLTREIQMITRTCGKNNIHSLDLEDLRALTIQTAAVTGVALAGSNRVY
jgi:glutamate synthase domain-containing protein 2